MVNSQQLDSLDTGQLRALAAELIAQVAQREQAIAAKDGELKYRQAKIDQLTHEMAVLKRWKFVRSGERLDAAQLSLLDETLDADIDCKNWHPRPGLLLSPASPDAPGCRPDCPAWRLPMSPRPRCSPPRAAAAP